jgi:ATP-binding cassette, subfamily B, bacterial PglK
MNRTKQFCWKGSLFYDFWRFFGFISQRRRQQLGLLLILMVIASLSEAISLSSVLPFLKSFNSADELLDNQSLQPLLSMFRVGTSTELVAALAGLFMISVVVCNGLRILTINTQTHLAAKISSDVSCRLYNQTIRQPYSFYLQQNSSDLIQLIASDVKSLSNAVLFPLLLLITNGCTAMALVIGLFLISWPVALTVTIVLGGAYAGLYRWRHNMLAVNSQIIVNSSQQQIKVVQESLGGIRDVLIGGTQDFFQMAYQQADIPFRRTTAANTVIAQTPRYIIEALAMLAIALLALFLGRNGDFSKVMPILGGLALGANRLLPALQSMFGSIVKIQSTRASLQRVLSGLQRSVDPLQLLVSSQGFSLQKEIEFKDVCFRYGANTKWVLNELNFSIPAKTTVGFVGATGSGKSTTADVILGLLKPQKGQIYVDGQLLEGERLRRWQKSIAHVPQSIFLSDATIAENIAFGISKDEIDFDQVCASARLAQIDSYIQALPNKYDTYVGERGIRLSGGQRQRIGIARALYHRASVIVFDEATSALDNSTENEVMEAISSLSHHFTIILIAHRLSTLKNCDRIIEFSHGRILASGSYQELMKQSGSFQKIAIAGHH